MSRIHHRLGGCDITVDRRARRWNATASHSSSLIIFSWFAFAVVFIFVPLHAWAANYVGETAGAFAVSHTGAATYSIPITVSPGVGGVQPTLALTYSSQAGEGLAGTGWTLSGLSAITRCPKTVAQDDVSEAVKLDDTDKFCMDGQRLVTVAGTYGANNTEYRTEIETFSKIVSYTVSGTSGIAWFKVWTKDGRILEYGNTADSRIEAQGRTEVLVWTLNKASDRNGNYMAVQYQEINASGEYYLSRINYAGAGLPVTRYIDFTYIARPWPVESYTAGAKSLLAKQLRTIRSWEAGKKMREYTLRYYGGSNYDGSTRLATLSECTWATGTEDCVYPTVMEFYQPAYSSMLANYPANVCADGSTTGNGCSAVPENYHTMQYPDINGDGQNDVCWRGNSGLACFVTNGNGGWNSSMITTTICANNSTADGGCDSYDNHSTIQFADFNADGAADLVFRSNSGIRVYTFNGSGFTYAFGTIACSDTDTSFGPCYSPNSISKSLTPVWDPNIKTIQYPDINGDGRADACYYTNTGFRCLLSTGTAFNSPVTTTICATGGNTPGVCNDAANFWTVRFADFDGDGKADLVYRGDQGIQVFRSTGTAFTHLYSTILCADGTNTYGTCNGEDNYHSARYADINADGKTDICFRADEGIRCALTTGNGIGTVITTDYCANASADGDCGFQFNVADIDGDGMADLLYRTNAGMRMRLSQSNRFISSPASFPDCATTDTDCDGEDNWSTINLADLNGDGSLDLVYRSDTGLRSRNLLLGRALLSSFSTGLKKAYSISYKPLTDNAVYTKGTGDGYPYLNYERPMHVVAAYETGDGIGGMYRREMSYSSAKVDLSGRGFLGFTIVKDHDTETGIRDFTRYSPKFPYTGFPIVIRKEMVNNGCFLYESGNMYTSMQLSPGRYFVYSSETTDIIQEAASGCSLVTMNITMPRYESVYGNITTVDTTSLLDGQQKTTNNTYSNDAASWKIGLLTRSTVTSKLPDGTTKTRTSSFGYDALGRLTSEIIEPDNPALRLTTTYTLDAYGNRIATTLSGQNVASRQSTIVYDASKRFAYQTQTRVGTVTHRVERTYDPFTGAVLTEKDANGFSTTTQYDPFGRKIQEDRPDGARTTWQYRDCRSIVGCPARAKMEVIERTTGSASKSVFSDFLNRPVRTAVEGFGGRWIHQDTEYDHRGFVRRTSLPYYANETAAWKTYTYDALGRVTQALLPDGKTVRTSYQGLKTVLTNTRGFTTTVTKDSQGQVIEVDQSGSIVKYQYDHFGNLLNAIDPNGAVTRATYDLRGRKLSISDPDRGIWRYEYNGFDEVVRQTDAKNQVTTYQYDTLGRLTRRSEADLISDWTYDTAANGIGKLAQATSSNGVTRAYTYDATAGRVTAVNSTLGGIGYTESMTYDAVGRVSKITYPATGFAVTNVYSAQGYLSEVKNAATGASYWRATAMDALGNITGESFGNGVTSSRTFNTYGWVRGISTNGSEGVVQSLRYNYDGEGNLGHRVDGSILETFAYDNRNRLVVATHQGKQLLIDYDNNGNIKSKSDVGTYNYSATRPHAVASISGGALTTSFNYDANGNMTAGNSRALIYTSYNKPTRIFANGVVSDFNYDSSHVRVQKKTGTKTTTYVSKLFERTEEPNRVTGTGSWYERKHYIYAGSRLVAIYVDWNAPELPIKYTDYVHTDNLGSLHRLTDAVGRTKTSFSYDPFGRPWDLNTGATRWQPHTQRPGSRGYTGHEMDGELTLVNMGAREYDPVIGRFLQPDPLSNFGANTQSWNAYAYANNSPLVYTDPTGLFSLSQEWRNAKQTLRNEVRNATRGILDTVGRLPLLGRPLQVAVLTNLSYGVAYGWSTGDWKTVGNAHVEGAIMAGTAWLGNIGVLGRMVGSGVNGYLQTGTASGFWRGFGAGVIPLDLGLPSYWKNPVANISIGITRDAIRGYIIAGQEGAMQQVGWGQLNNALGHLVGGLMGDYRGFRNGAFFYEGSQWARGEAITLGNVISGPPGVMNPWEVAGPVKYSDYGRILINQMDILDHELGHIPQSHLFGATYIGFHGFALGASWVGTGGRSTHSDINVLENMFHPYPYSQIRW